LNLGERYMPDMLNVENGQLYYDVAGDPKHTTLVMIHAGVADHRMWDDQVTAFKDKYRVVRYDTRGFGRTTSTNDSFSNRQDVRDLLDHLGIAKAVVMGCSRGGQIAIDFTLEFPDRVLGLIPVCAGVGGYEAPPPPANELDRFNEMDRLWEARDIEKLIEMEINMWLDGPRRAPATVSAGIRARMNDMLHLAYANHQHEQLQPRVLQPPAVGRLNEIRVPTLVIIGALDTTGSVASGEYMAANIPGAKKVVFPDTAHMPNLEQPDRFNQVVLDFLASVR